MLRTTTGVQSLDPTSGWQERTDTTNLSSDHQVHIMGWCLLQVIILLLKSKAKQQEPKSFLVYFFEWVLIRLSHLIQNSETGRVSAHSHKHESSWRHLMFLMLSLLETLSPGTSRNSVSKPSGYSFTYSSPHTIKHNVWNSSKMWKCKWLLTTGKKTLAAGSRSTGLYLKFASACKRSACLPLFPLL